MTKEETKAFIAINRKAISEDYHLPYRKVNRVCNGTRLECGDGLNIDEAERFIHAIETTAQITVAYLRSEIENAKQLKRI